MTTIETIPPQTRFRFFAQPCFCNPLSKYRNLYFLNWRCFAFIESSANCIMFPILLGPQALLEPAWVRPRLHSSPANVLALFYHYIARLIKRLRLSEWSEAPQPGLL